MGKSIFDLSTNGIQIPQNLVKYANSKYLSRYANADDMEKKYNVLNQNYNKLLESLDGVKSLLNSLSDSNLYSGTDAQNIIDGASNAAKMSSSAKEIFEGALTDLKQQIDKVRQVSGGSSGSARYTVSDGKVISSGKSSGDSGSGHHKHHSGSGGSNDSHHGGSSDWQSSWDKEVGNQIPDRPKPTPASGVVKPGLSVAKEGREVK